MTTSGLILAAGKGTRINSDKINKVVLRFNGKPLIQYGINLLHGHCDKVYIMIGAYSDSVKEVVEKYNSNDKNIKYIDQLEQLGTGHAVKTAIEYLEKSSTLPDLLIVGYGDHMMFYNSQVIEELIISLNNKNTKVSLVTTNYKNPEELAWGHILRDKKGNFKGFVEHKDANEEEKKITELNAGLYCFNTSFLLETKDMLHKSEVSGEYYINDFADLALERGYQVKTVEVPFENVGIGINTQEQKIKSEHFYIDLHCHKAVDLT